MYCMKGNNPGVDDRNTNAAVQPLYNLTRSDWWLHHINKCDEFPPEPGNFLELPVNGTFTVEHAVNRAFTTTITSNPSIGTYGDGKDHPDFGLSRDGKNPGSDCISEPNMHTQNETMAAGTAFAISYTSNLAEVTPENLVVFTVLYNTPWKRLATYHVPDLPPCPPGGCICAHGWVPNACGEPNMYMLGYRCNVTGTVASHVHRLQLPAKPPLWCELNNRECVNGSKQMIFWNQADGNNVKVSGLDKFGFNKFPGYSMKMGYGNGAQTDIFTA
ncbi:hypothetical protein D9619_012681 [Psilocybe cf. subviscida]|uniref:Uncharacterized protein n=1 Tax=Psilocybe cf. subviscida TaxID=2480587 RepID=A0A8H5B6S0_9AGAR|nr:hypothetical protein D9619_012681 [Psilocybe cf. subviscida]